VQGRKDLRRKATCRVSVGVNAEVVLADDEVG